MTGDVSPTLASRDLNAVGEEECMARTAIASCPDLELIMKALWRCIMMAAIQVCHGAKSIGDFLHVQYPVKD